MNEQLAQSRKLYGVVCANVTPMTRTGELDEASLRNLVRYLADCGMHGIYPNGTTGEGMLLSAEERDAQAQWVVEENAKRMVVYVQCGSMSTQQTIARIRAAKRIGADGAGVMTPVFFTMDNVALMNYYDEVLPAEPDYPIYAYNITKNAKSDLVPSVFGPLMDRHENFMGMKYTGDDVTRFLEYMCCSQRSPQMLIGNDQLFLTALHAGAVGTVSGGGYVYPKLMLGIYESFCRGEYERARELSFHTLALKKLTAGVPTIPSIKAMLKMKGVIACDACRKPVRALTSEEYQKLEKALTYYQKTFE